MGANYGNDAQSRPRDVVFSYLFPGIVLGLSNSNGTMKFVQQHYFLSQNIGGHVPPQNRSLCEHMSSYSKRKVTQSVFAAQIKKFIGLSHNSENAPISSELHTR